MISLLTSLSPLIITVHFIICIFLVIVILLQAGKGADMGAAFGAGSSQTLFGARGAATFLSKMTTGAALLFLVTSVSLAAIQKSRHRSDVQNDSVVIPGPVAPAPVTPPPPPVDPKIP